MKKFSEEEQKIFRQALIGIAVLRPDHFFRCPKCFSKFVKIVECLKMEHEKLKKEKIKNDAV